MWQPPVKHKDNTHWKKETHNFIFWILIYNKSIYTKKIKLTDSLKTFAIFESLIKHKKINIVVKSMP